MFYHENHEDKELLHPLKIMAQHMCNMYGYNLLFIDKVGDLNKNTIAWNSLKEAMEDLRFKDYQWVFFDRGVKDNLHEFNHPREKIVYVIGADKDGYGVEKSLINGHEILHIKSVSNQEYYALMCLSVAMNHRYYQVEVFQ